MGSEKSCDGKTSPLLAGEGGEEAEERMRGWWSKMVDAEEIKTQIMFSAPMILTNVFYYCITLVSVMYAGHLGELQLAGSTLANSWASVSGFAFMTGLSGALETLCGQGFGAKMYKVLGIHLQASCIISFFFSLVISIIWFYTEPLLLYLQQDPDISKSAALYMKYLIPGLFAYAFQQNILRFLQAQSVVMPLIWLSLLPLLIHFGIVHALVHPAGFDFKGASLAASISLWISTLLLVLYVFCAKRFRHTWQGFSLDSLWYIHTNLKLALPSAAMVCLEDWAFEILVFLSGLMPNSEITTSLTAMCVNTQAIAYMLTYGLSAAASTRVSNELGAGNLGRAKNAMKVTLKLSILLAIVETLFLAFGHSTWAGFFSDSPSIIKEFSSMTPLLAISLAIDSIQGAISGVARGCGWQEIGVYINLAMFYFVGMPVACLLVFKFNLGVKGLWIGLICGLLCQGSTLLLITFCRNLSKVSLTVNREKEPDSLIC